MKQKQKFFKLAYPLVAALTPKKMKSNDESVIPPVSFYSLSATLNNGAQISFEALRGFHVLLVNTASFCGYTGQYDELQKLHEQYGHKVKLIGFPSNDFGEQEPHSDEEIAGFCRVNYGVSFPLTQKTPVTGPDKHPVYGWLSNPEQNGWNSKAPDWNFCKYLIDEEGRLLHFFNAGVSPMSKEIVGLIT